MALLPGDQAGPYRIVSMIGKGGMGEVYRATDTRLNRDVALKVSAEAFDERFACEARAIASLNHPNICTLHDVGPNYLVMELLEGAAPAGPMPVEEALAIANQIADALAAAHEKGIVHRDLKPGNIIVKQDGTVKVLDFGLAKMRVLAPASGEDSPTMTMAATQAGMILGTAAYMAPEQAKGKPVDARADIWAFGVVLYELSTGHRLFQGEDVTEILASVVKDQPDLSAAPPRLRRLLDACLQKDPRKRLQAIADMRLLLDTPPQPAVIQRAWVGWMAAALVAFAGLAMAAIHFRQVTPNERILRVTLPLPDNSVARFLALSPDGRNLVLSTRHDDVNSLFLRPLHSEVVRPLSGTMDANLPFWSPDSKWIAFFVTDALQLIPAAGGPVQTLCKAEGSGFGGTWNQSGVILFASERGPLRRTTASGSPCAALGAEDPKVQSTLPFFLPGGDHFLYTRRVLGDPASSGVYLATLSEPVGRKLLPDLTGAFYAPPAASHSVGHVMFIRENNLMAQPFDPAGLELAGDPFQVLPDVGYSSARPQPAASAAADVLVYRKGGRRETQLTWYGRDGRELGTVGHPVYQFAISLSPDGNSVAVLRVESASSSIWIHDLVRGAQIRVTSSVEVVSPAVWSRAHQEVWFSIAGPEAKGLYRRSSSNGRLELVEAGNTTEKRKLSDLSRDGRFAVYTEEGSNTQSDIWYARLEAGKPDPAPMRLLGSAAVESQGQLSPDGKWLAYYSNESGLGQIYVRPFPAGSEVWRISPGAGREPRWSNDGKELYFVVPSSSDKATLMAVPLAHDATGGLRVGEARALFETRLGTTRPSANVWTYSPHPDGKRFLLSVLADQSTPDVHLITNWQKAMAEQSRDR